MKDYIKQHLTPSALIIIVSVCLYSIGFYIHNNYLSKYRVANFDLIKGKYIYVGLTYFAIMFAIVLVALADVSFSDSRSNMKWKNIFVRIVRFESILLVLYEAFPDKNERLFEGVNINIFGLARITERFADSFLFALALGFTTWFLGSMVMKGQWPEKEGTKFNFMLSLILVVPTTLLSAWGNSHSQLFKDLFGFVVYSFIMFHFLFLGGLIPVPAGAVKTSMLIKGLNQKARLLESTVLMVASFAIFFMGSMNSYSNHIYGRMPGNFGGAKPIDIKVYCSDSTIVEGKLIDETESNLVVQPKDESRVIVISRSGISRSEIELPPKKPDAEK